MEKLVAEDLRQEEEERKRELQVGSTAAFLLVPASALDLELLEQPEYEPAQLVMRMSEKSVVAWSVCLEPLVEAAPCQE